MQIIDEERELPVHQKLEELLDQYLKANQSSSVRAADFVLASSFLETEVARLASNRLSTIT